MLSFAVTALIGFAAAQSITISSAVSSLSSSLVPSTTSISSTPFTAPTVATAAAISKSSSGSNTTITVAADGSGQFTAINAAVSAAQASSIPTVTVLPGTYLEAVTVLGTATVTIVGATATSVADWSQNRVTIANPSAALSIGTSSIKGITLRNINIVNTATTGPAVVAYAVSLRGSNIAFYGCSIVSSGAATILASSGVAFFANSYIEGSDKLFYNVPTSYYVYKSTIVPLSSGSSIVYSKGTTVGSSFYNSTVIFDSSSVQQKSGFTNTGVFLAAPNNAGAVAIYRNTVMGNLIAPAGIHSSAAIVSSFYGEFLSTGAGSYAQNAAARASYDVLLNAEQVSQYAIEKVFGTTFSPYGSSSLAWLDQDVLASLQASDTAQLASATFVSSMASLSAVQPTSSNFVSSDGLNAISSSLSASYTVSASSFSSVSTSVIGSASAGSSASTTSTNSVSVSTVNPASTSSTSTPTSSTCSAATASSTLVVSKTPGLCEYGSVAAAINALPSDSKPYTIQIGAGTYVEQISITRKGKVTLIGVTNFSNDYTQNQVRIETSFGVLTSAGQNELTPVIYAKKTSDNSGMAVYNIDFVNTYPQTKNTAALAADFYGANIAAYGCSFIGFQDTLLANKGTQVFSNCYIEGSVDFVWGFSTAYFHQCMVVTNTPGSCIAAQSRSSADVAGGYVFDSCMISYSSTYGSTYGLSYLGRPYSQYSITVYKNSYIDKHINDAGWSIWSTSSPQTSDVMFGEYNNMGPGSWQASTKRASFATNLTATQAAKYELAAWIGDTTWLDMIAYNLVPSYSLTGPQTVTSPSANTTTTSSVLPSATTTGPSTTATTNAHPDSGSVPPAGAVIVALNGTHDAAYTSLTTALASLPKDSTNQTIFLYPGSYNEQIPSINRPGAVRIIGYTSGNPGQSYKDNQVTVTFARGLSLNPLPAGHNNAETSTLSTASNRITLYNINIINTENLDGTQSSYVTLAASIYGNDIAFYGCSFDGWQDTLLTGATTGYQYYESCYIGGAIDFIWGYSKAYFKGCTIGAKRQSSAITAHSRASSSAIGGYIFDQCLFTAAPSASVDLTNKVYLGRPYSQYALVVIKNSYLDSSINPSGWKIWSTTDPRTDHVTFAEYNNVGPGNWENNVAARTTFGYATLLTSDTYSLSTVMDSTEWIDMTYWNSITTPQPAAVVTAPTTPTNITVNGTSIFNGTIPPVGALLVSKAPITGTITYSTIQDALNAASSSSKTNATIFIYPGVYEEQLIVNKSGHTIFQGYSTATDDYSKNQVTIQASHGVDTQGTSGSNTDGATFYVKGNYFHAYNINFRNNFGTQQNMASLGFAVQSSKYAGLYGCQIYGNQDTLSVSGYLFTFNTYIEGNVDFIYGTGAGYFLSSTISPNEDGVSITASKRATNSTNAGFVFDQCTVKPAAGSSTFTNVGLGRPWNSLSRVAYVQCYLDSMISAAGWNQWSKSSPQTDGVVYGEYRNYGPGSNICNRATFSQQFSDTDVVQFQLRNFFPSTAFIDFSHVDKQPFAVGVGSAQTCSSTSSSSSAILSTSSLLSSTRLSSTSTKSSTLSLVTAYTTITSTIKLTASTTVTASDVMSTIVVKTTDTISITEADVVKTSTQKATATISITSPDLISTSTSVITQDTGLTITPVLVTETSTVKETLTERGITTLGPVTSTVKSTTTNTVLATSTPKATTVTRSEGSTVVVTSLITQKGVSTTVKTTTSIQPTSTKTTTLKAKSTVTILTESLKTVTKKSKTTLFCIPTDKAKRMARRGAIIPRAAAGTTTLTQTTSITVFVKTSTATQAGSTSLTTQTITAATKTTTQAGNTSTATVTSFVKTSTIAQAGATIYSTVISTSKIGKTTTLKAGTTTIFSTSYATITSLSTVKAATVTLSIIRTDSKFQITTIPQQTVYVTASSDVTSTTKSTLPAVTTTVYHTSTLGGGVTTATITAAPVTKTVTQKLSTTVVQWETKTAKNIALCL